MKGLKGMKIKWTNINSGEIGFVKSVNKDKKDFVNSDFENAGVFSEKRVESIIKTLAKAQPQNAYEAVNNS